MHTRQIRTDQSKQRTLQVAARVTVELVGMAGDRGADLAVEGTWPVEQSVDEVPTGRR
jgi:hypothetical protein